MNHLYKSVGYMAGIAALGSMLAGPAQADGLEQKANASLSFENVTSKVSGNKTTYKYDRVFRESNGVNVRLTEGKICYKTDNKCETGKVDYNIPANSEFRLKDKEFWTTFDREELIIQYEGKDSRGNNVTVKATFKHPQ